MAANPDEVSVADWLREQPALTGTAPGIDPRALPDDPTELFLDWIREAVRSGVAEPHAATLATVDADGLPDARTLILKDVDPLGWAVATRRSSRAGAQLATNPVAALSFWWQPILRAVRVRGTVREASQAESEADLAARSPAAREGIAPGDWVKWRIAPSRIEFWQGATDRRHLRIVYTSTAGGWSREILGGETTPTEATDEEAI